MINSNAPRLLINCETNQDTLRACCMSLEIANYYLNGEYEYTVPHYPLPTTIGEVIIVKDTVAIYATNRNIKVLENIWFK